MKEFGFNKETLDFIEESRDKDQSSHLGNGVMIINQSVAQVVSDDIVKLYNDFKAINNGNVHKMMLVKVDRGDGATLEAIAEGDRELLNMLPNGGTVVVEIFNEEVEDVTNDD